eukprot:TRINITY_DN9027_c0_g1_i1.p1 TRINITY_DN9027_c0_g1~~TRINITY_DN9027_c0_g1_i1.p1  ORF type:complete len:219 (+),score=27.06 TRINITY_DN9027_c0_g1_i1:138-794(+)
MSSISVLLGLLILSVLLVSVRSQACGAGNCGDCVEQEGCGWCESNLSPDSCAPGESAAGPTDPADCKLGIQDDEWYYGQCPDPCNQFGVCFECQQNSCGWCFNDDGSTRCQGSPTNCDDWRLRGPDSCSPPLRCKDFSECNECVTSEDADCEWCPSSDKCFKTDVSEDDDEPSCEDDFITPGEEKTCPAVKGAASGLPSIASSLVLAYVGVMAIAYLM